ncbi:hypothetical protein HS088_TW19G00236 [Tripterygium wilfordii]|uniref:Uncharacterized protein n=1 Tax=Tripterygium wilfordii TaxID=458696 RepID=A0A7J7C915_TRIWF|nr:hypothetical protein HS088_TW19G00236 [Tripterygium wilfordii]
MDQRDEDLVSPLGKKTRLDADCYLVEKSVTVEGKCFLVEKSVSIMVLSGHSDSESPLLEATNVDGHLQGEYTPRVRSNSSRWSSGWPLIRRRGSSLLLGITVRLNLMVKTVTGGSRSLL